MKKVSTSIISLATLSSLAACKKNDAKTTETKATKMVENKSSNKTIKEILHSKVKKGKFKIGFASSNFEFGQDFQSVVNSYTQDAVVKGNTGDQYFSLPSGLFFTSSEKFNSFITQSKEFKDEIAKLKAWIMKYIGIGKHNEDDGYYHPDDPANLNHQHYINLNKNIKWVNLNELFLVLMEDTDFNTTKANFDSIFNFRNLSLLYQNLKGNTSPTRQELKEAIEKSDILLIDKDLDTIDKDDASTHLDKGTLYWNTNPVAEATTNKYPITNIKSFVDLSKSFKDIVKKDLSDKTNLASKNIDTIFVSVTDEVENSSDVYKNVVEKKEFKETQLFFIGEKAKSQSGASSKTFAGGMVSTASFNKYAATYVAGFQAAVGAIKYSSSEDEYEETTVSFLIGATSESEDKKKAFAFRRGVEAAAAHSAYSRYLKVKFVSKTEDSSKSSKKLYREVSEWEAKEDSKTKLYEFTSSDTFSDADRKIVYIAGSTAKDWIGTTSEDENNQFKYGDKTGLIGALYNYDTLSSGDQGKDHEDLTDKTYSKGVWIILDKANRKQTASDDNSLFQNSSATGQEDHFVSFERGKVKFYGAIGKEKEGSKQYIKKALQGSYMGGPNYMVGKHTIFGAPLDLNSITVSKSGTNKSISVFDWATKDGNNEVSKSIWSYVGGKDSASKAKSRYKDALYYATEKEVTEAELTKSSPWLK